MARRGLLTQTAEAAKDILGVETIDVVADKGYFKIEDIEACENAGITLYVPRPAMFALSNDIRNPAGGDSGNPSTLLL